MNQLTQKRLHEVIRYEPKTGEVFRLESVANVRPGKVVARPSKNGYLRMHIDGRLYYIHRLAWFYVHGEWPICIDHIDGEKTNNKISNLRSTTQKGNLQNLNEKSKSASGLRGAYYHPKTKSWQAKIMIDGKTKSLGYYKTPKDAHDAYVLGKKKYHLFNTELRK